MRMIPLLFFCSKIKWLHEKGTKRNFFSFWELLFPGLMERDRGTNGTNGSGSPPTNVWGFPFCSPVPQRSLLAQESLIFQEVLWFEGSELANYAKSSKIKNRQGNSGGDMKKTMVPITEAAEFLGVTAQTLRNWEREGKLLPDWKTPSGARRYDLARLRTVTFELEEDGRE